MFRDACNKLSQKKKKRDTVKIAYKLKKTLRIFYSSKNYLGRISLITPDLSTLLK